MKLKTLQKGDMMKIKIIKHEDLKEYESNGWHKLSLDWWFEKYHFWFTMMLLGGFLLWLGLITL